MKNSQLFIISDLHLGSGGPRDNFDNNDKERLLMSFLDHVQREDGELIILGDMVDLWRFKLKTVVRRRDELFARLNEMAVSYVPGNHDQAIVSLPQSEELVHPLFKKITLPFVRNIGGREFRFIHGHEIDPLNRNIGPRVGRALGLSATPIEWAKGTQVFSSDFMEDVLLEILEKMLLPYYVIAEEVKRYLCGPDKLGGRISLRAGRQHKLLFRHTKSRRSFGNDVTVSAHTHKPGLYSDWYYNTGSWTQEANNFLRILPDGLTQLFDWTSLGPRPNHTVLCSN